MTKTPRPALRKPTLAERRWIYGVLLAAGGVALTYGWVNGEQLGSLLTLAGALLGVGGLALANPTKDSSG